MQTYEIKVSVKETTIRHRKVIVVSEDIESARCTAEAVAESDDEVYSESLQTRKANRTYTAISATTLYQSITKEKPKGENYDR